MGQSVYDPFNKSVAQVNSQILGLTCVTLLLNVYVCMYVYIYSLIGNFIYNLQTHNEHNT